MKTIRPRVTGKRIGLYDGIYSSFTKGDIPASTIFGTYGFYDKEAIAHKNRLGMIQNVIRATTGNVETQLIAFDNIKDSTNSAAIVVGITPDGKKFTQAPNPDTEDRSNAIATTSYVRSRIDEVDVTATTLDLNTLTLNTDANKRKSKRYVCSQGAAQNITNRPISGNEPFELTVDNVRYVGSTAFNTVQRYTSVARKRSYTRWCQDGTWQAWMCDVDVVIYGTVSAAQSKSFAYVPYGEGFNRVEIEPYYDSNTSPIRNRVVLTLSNTTTYDRDILKVDDTAEHVKIENGTITLSVTGTKTLSFMIKYTNNRA